jgi:hypothetical protein
LPTRLYGETPPPVYEARRGRAPHLRALHGIISCIYQNCPSLDDPYFLVPTVKSRI